MYVVHGAGALFRGVGGVSRSKLYRFTNCFLNDMCSVFIGFPLFTAQCTFTRIFFIIFFFFSCLYSMLAESEMLNGARFVRVKIERERINA